MIVRVRVWNDAGGWFVDVETSPGMTDEEIVSQALAETNADYPDGAPGAAFWGEVVIE